MVVSIGLENGALFYRKRSDCTIGVNLCGWICGCGDLAEFLFWLLLFQKYGYYLRVRPEEETYEVFGDIKGYLIVIMESGKLTELLAWLLNSAKGPLGAHLVSCWVPIWTETNEHDYVFLQYFWCPGATKIKWKVGFSQEVGFDKLMQQHRDKLEIECKLH